MSNFFEDQSGSIPKLNPAQLTAEVIEDGNRWSELDAAASILEEGKKALLAKLALGFVERSLDGAAKRAMSATQAEMYALASDEYQNHLSMMISARKAANSARVRYDLGRKRLDLIQTAHANLRNEMRLSGFNT